LPHSVRLQAAPYTAHFFVKNLFSNEENVVHYGFEGLRLQRVGKLDFSKILSDIAKKELLIFAEYNPNYGMKDDRTLGQNIIVILGECVSDEKLIDLKIREFLGKLRGESPGYEMSILSALARTGDSKSIDVLCALYLRENDLSKKELFADALGEASVVDGLKLLAKDLRSDEVLMNGVGFNQRALGALALCRYWPNDNPPRFRMGGYRLDDFIVAEKWAKKMFGTTWSVPRPPIRLVQEEEF
jgi:hypothetical protein